MRQSNGEKGVRESRDLSRNNGTEGSTWEADKGILSREIQRTLLVKAEEEDSWIDCEDG